ncbi:hypothetical protein C8J56DRAFT_1123514 [Mycena floridula]|nr:hypothetical protein C8J56DRAFT_1123514 [Mycena floridula]
MSKSSTATASKIPAVPSKSAWSKGPPQSSSSPRSQSPVPSNSTQPSHLTHSRRPSALGGGVSVKDGISIPRNTAGSSKPGSSVTFGSIDDASAPISSSPAATPAIKAADSVKSFGSVPATTSQINGKPTTTKSSPSTSASSTPTASTPSKLKKFDVAKLFQNPSTAGPAPPPPSDTNSSPSIRPTGLPAQQSPQGQPSGIQPTASSQMSGHSYPAYPQNGMRPSQNGPGNGPGQGGPRSPVYPRQMPNGNGSRPPGTPNGPGPSQMSSGLSSPRLAPMTHNGQPSGLPPQQQPMPQMQMWPGGYYYVDGGGYYQQPAQWYGLPQQMPPGQHQAPPSQNHMSPHPGMPMSPRNQPPSLHGTPTPSHAVLASHPSHPTPLSHHSSSNSISGLSSPPPTPSSAIPPNSARLNTSAAAFVPTSRPSTKITLKNPDGTEMKLENLKNKVVPTTPTPPTSSTPPIGSASPKRRSGVPIRIEAPEDRAKRLAEEQEKEKEKTRLKAEAEQQAKAAKDEEERKAREEKERKEKEEAEKKRKEEEEQERVRKEEEAKEQQRKAEEELKAKLLKEEEDRKRKEEEEAAEREKERLEKEKQERLKKEEEEARVKKEQEEQDAKVAQPETTTLEEIEEGQVLELDGPETATVETKEKPKEPLRITTTPLSPETRRRPGPLDLTGTKNAPAALPSALATARIIDNINAVPYPEGVKSPMVELNVNAKDGKFRYDRDFLLQFMSICKEKPDMLPPLDAIGLEPTDQATYNPMTRGGSGRHRTASTPTPRQFPGSSSGFTKPGYPPMGGFIKPNEGFPANRAISISGASSSSFNGRPPPMQRTPSQGGAGAGSTSGSNRTRSQRGAKREPSKQGGPVGGGGHQNQGSSYNNYNSQQNMSLEPVAPLNPTANRWDRKSVAAVEPDSPALVDRKVKGLLNKLTMEKFDSISDQIIDWANKSEREKDGRTLIQVIRLVFEKATDEAAWSEMYARLCRKMMETISPKVQDDGIKNNEGKPIAGGQLFRKYLLNRCQEDFERGWVAKEATAAAAATKASEDQAAKVASEQEGTEEAALYSEEYYAAQKAKRQGLGLIKFIGELFKLQMLTERIMHECVKKLLGNVENPEEEEIESLCKLLATVGASLDTVKARAHMDVYFSRMKELTKSGNVTSRMQFMLQDLIELRERKWVSRNLVAAPTTIAQIHEAAAKEKAVLDKESYQRQMSMSRGGSKRGGDRGDYANNPDGWAVAGNASSAPRPPPKAGDLSKFGKLSNTTAPMTFGPASVFSGKKEGKKESLSRTNSSQNMFSMLSSNSEANGEASTSKGSRPSSSRKASVDFSQTGLPEAAPQRKRLILAPRSKPAVEETGAPAAANDSEDGSDEEEDSTPEMSEAEATKKIKEDLKEFYSVRNLEEAEVYFTKLPPQHHPTLVEKLLCSALESKDADAVLVAGLFEISSKKGICSIEAFETGFSAVAEMLDDVAIDAPKAPKLMAIMLKGPAFEPDHISRISSKSEENGAALLL